MKRLFTLLSPVLLAGSLFSQKSTWYAGGSAGFSTTQSKQDANNTGIKVGKTTNWTFSPEFGTFITNHVQLGFGLNITGGKTDNQNTPVNAVSRNNGLGGTIYSRYFFGKESFKPFAGVSFSVGGGKSKSTNGTNVNESRSAGFNTGINAGFGYALGKRVTAIGSFGFLGYSSGSSEDLNTHVKYKQSSFGLDASSLGDRFNVGIYYTL